MIKTCRVFSNNVINNNEALRLFGINAPEIKGKEKDKGIESGEALRRRIPEGSKIVIETVKDKKGKYGRYLAIVFSEGENINEWMVKNKFAETKMY